MPAEVQTWRAELQFNAADDCRSIFSSFPNTAVAETAAAETAAAERAESDHLKLYSIVECTYVIECT